MIIRRSITKEEISNLPKIKFPGKIIVVQTAKEAAKAVEFLTTHPLVGIDTETKPSFKKGKSHQVALLQVSTKEICFLFRLNMIGFPDSLVHFFENHHITKVGLSLKDDFAALHKRAAFSHDSFIDLQDYVNQFSIEDKSLQKIYGLLFGQKISKSQRLTNWEADVLSDAQKRYAATDAWACYNIYELLSQLKETGDYTIEVKPEITEEN